MREEAPAQAEPDPRDGIELGAAALPFVVGSEDEAAPIAARRVQPGGTVYADEAAHRDAPHARFTTHRINHGFAFSDEGACTNQAESCFARLRRAESGQHHHLSGLHLPFHAGEMAWREDMRREGNGVQLERCTADALTHPKSKNWRSYGQRANA